MRMRSTVFRRKIKEGQTNVEIIPCIWKGAGTQEKSQRAEGSLCSVLPLWDLSLFVFFLLNMKRLPVFYFSSESFQIIIYFTVYLQD